nr:glycerophosphodiester phosphodiesterase family protein [uncultured Sphaerochaeta sp.]
MEKGIERGADYLEIDVQLTRDHIPVIFHDIDTMGKTGLPGVVQDYTFKELNQLYEVPSLESVMQWGREHSVYFALEIKSFYYKTSNSEQKLMPLINEIVKGTGMVGQVEAFGVNYKALSILKNLNPEFEIGLIVPFIPNDPVSLMREMQAMVYLSYIYNLRQDEIALLQRSGYYVSGAILREQQLIDYAIESKVDMFEYDKPERFKARKR